MRLLHLGLCCRDLRWAALRPNLPWLVDAAACLLLDVCILLQILAERLRSTGAEKDEENIDDLDAMRL